MRKIQIHWSFVVVSIIMLLIGWIKIFGLFVLFVTVHESAHIITAKLFGGKLGGLHLSAVGEAAEINGLEDISILRRYIVFLSGPTINLFFAFIFFLFGFRGSMQINLLIGFFNLLPVFPLDGGRILQQFLGFHMGILRGNRLLTQIGCSIGLLIMLCGLICAVLYPCNISLLCIGFYIRRWNKHTIYPLTLDFFLLMSHKTEAKKRIVPIRLFAAYSNTLLKHIAERLDWDHQTNILINNRPENFISESIFITYVLENGLNGTVGEAWEILDTEQALD